MLQTFQKSQEFQNSLGFILMLIPIFNTLYIIIGWWEILSEKVNWNKFFNKF